MSEPALPIESPLRSLAAHVARRPDDVGAAQALVAVARRQGTGREAVAILEGLARRHKGSVALHGVLASACADEEMFRESLPHFRRVLELVPGQGADFFQCYSRALARAGRVEEAIILAEGALQAFPRAVELYLQQANNYTALGDPAKAEIAYRRGLAFAPDDATLLHSVGLMEMLTSGMKTGFDLYRNRRRLPDAELAAFPIPEWNGERGKRLLVWAEQGVGDIVMFAGLLPWLMRQEVIVTLAVWPKLVSLFARSCPELSVIALGPQIMANIAANYDAHLPMGELMRLGLPHATPADHAPYLKADPEATARLRKEYLRLAAARGAKRIVGVSWHTINPRTGYLRNIPLAEWKPLFQTPGVFFVSLQYDGRAEEVAAANARGPVLHRDAALDGRKDTDLLAAYVAAMDEVVTIQNATAHLAGALGVPTQLLLCAASDWRWGLERTDSLWYKSVRILRQKRPGDWKPVLKEAAKNLQNA